MHLWTAFVLGFVGSIHCAGMCGPLILALPLAGNSRTSFVIGRLAYNFGRIMTYCALGIVFGLIGKSFSLAGWQRWASFAAGILVLLSYFTSSHLPVRTPVVRLVGRIKLLFATFLQKRTLSSQIILGSINGFLPCGLVYVAGAAAAASGELLHSISFMFFFGLGTIPMMLGIGLLGKKLQFAFRFRWQKAVPACVLTLGVLLILRGLALGIPYVSPEVSHGKVHCKACGH